MSLHIERYAVPVFEPEGPVPADAFVRLARMDVEPTDTEAMARSRSAAAAARVEAVVSAGCVVRAVEEYTVAFTSARKS